MSKNPSQPTATKNSKVSDINQEVGPSQFAQQAKTERAAFLAQKLSQAQDKSRNFKKNKQLRPNIQNDDDTGDTDQEDNSDQEDQLNQEEESTTAPSTDRKTAIGESFRYLGQGLHSKKGDSQTLNKMAHGARDIGKNIGGHQSKKQAEKVIQSQNAARNKNKNLTLAKSLSSIKDGAEMGKQLALKESSKAILNTLWTAVWEDPTLLTLLGLNAYLVASLLIPSLAQFGDDDIIGTPLGGGRIAQTAEKAGINAKALRLLPKIVEILLVAIADLIILALIVLNVYIYYKLITTGYWDKLRLATNLATGDLNEFFEILIK